MTQEIKSQTVLVHFMWSGLEPLPLTMVAFSISYSFPCIVNVFNCSISSCEKQEIGDSTHFYPLGSLQKKAHEGHVLLTFGNHLSYFGSFTSSGSIMLGFFSSNWQSKTASMEHSVFYCCLWMNWFKT